MASATALSSTPSRRAITPPPLRFIPASIEAVRRVGRRFFMNAASAQINEECFERAYQAMKGNDWEVVIREQRILARMVNAVGQTLIMKAIASDEYDLIKKIRDKNLFFEIVDQEENNPIHYLSRILSIDFERYYQILHLGTAGIEARNRLGQTALHIAATSGHKDAVNCLLRRGASIHKAAPYSELSERTYLVPLGFAVAFGHQACVESLLAHPGYDSDYRVQSDVCPTYLHIAVHYNRLEILIYLLSNYSEKMKSSLFRENENHMTPASYAAYLGNAEALRILKKHEDDITCGE